MQQNEIKSNLFRKAVGSKEIKFSMRIDVKLKEL